MKKENIYAYSFCMVFALVVMGLSLSMEYLYSTIFPLIMSSLIFVLAAIGLMTTLLRSEKSSSSRGGSESGEVARKQWSSDYVTVYTLLVAYFITIYLLGFIIATPLFVFTYTKLRGMKWSSSIGFAAAVAAFQYGVFIMAIKVNLYGGLLFE